MKEVTWKTVPNITDTSMLAQHAYAHKDCEVPIIGGTYSGNISLCGRFSIGEDYNVSLPIDQIAKEELNEVTCCKTCLRIYKKNSEQKDERSVTSKA